MCVCLCWSERCCPSAGWSLHTCNQFHPIIYCTLNIGPSLLSSPDCQLTLMVFMLQQVFFFLFFVFRCHLLHNTTATIQNLHSSCLSPPSTSPRPPRPALDHLSSCVQPRNIPLTKRPVFFCFWVLTEPLIITNRQCVNAVHSNWHWWNFVVQKNFNDFGFVEGCHSSASWLFFNFFF